MSSYIALYDAPVSYWYWKNKKVKREMSVSRSFENSRKLFS